MVARREVLEKSRRKLRKFWRIFWFSLIGIVVVLATLITLYQTNVIYGISKKVDSAPQNSDWTVFRYDLAHTGNAGTDTLPQGVLAWTFTTDNGVTSSPAVVDGMVYFGSKDGNIYALDAATGEKRWAFKTGSWVVSSPIVSGGVVYCGSNDGNLYALDAKTGTEIWSFSTAYTIRSSPAIADGIVYFATDDYYVYAVNASNGKLIWKHKTNNRVTASPVVSNGVVAVGSADGQFYLFNAKDGRLRVNYPASHPISASAATQNGTVYFADTGDDFVAMKITAKSWPWENKILIYWRALYIYGVAPKPPSPSGYLWDLLISFQSIATSSPALTANNAFIGCGNDMMSIDLTTHKIAWTYHAGDRVVSSPALAGDVLYFGSEDGKLYALNQADGSELWKADLGGPTTSSPAIANGMLYIGCDDGKLYAFK